MDPSLSWYRSVPGENAPAHNSRGKVKSTACLQHSGFLEGCLTKWCPSHLTQHWWNCYSSNAWGLLKTKKSRVQLTGDHMTQCNQKVHHLRLLPQERRRWAECTSNILAFQRVAQGTIICVTWIGALTGSWHALDIYWPLKTKENGVACCCRTREYTLAQTPMGARDYKLLKEKLASLSNWEIGCIGLQKLHPAQKVSETPESLANRKATRCDKKIPITE